MVTCTWSPRRGKGRVCLQVAGGQARLVDGQARRPTGQAWSGRAVRGHGSASVGAFLAALDELCPPCSLRAFHAVVRTPTLCS